MQITNKKLAFYIATIIVVLATVGQSFGILTPDQSNTLIAAISMIAGAFGLGDIGFDWINAARGNFDTVKTETVTVKDTVGGVLHQSKVEEKAIVGSDGETGLAG